MPEVFNAAAQLGLQTIASASASSYKLLMRRLDLKKLVRLSTPLVLSLNAIFMIKDISDDVHEGAGFWHIGPEILIVIVTVLIAVFAMKYLVKFKESADHLRHTVGKLEADNQDWQNRTRAYSEGLAREIDRQMMEWGLSNAEKEIALLLLKGLSNREIAEIRDTSEHTIKQQSSAIYKKSGTGTRAELSAFFLEDLLDAPVTHAHAHARTRTRTRTRAQTQPEMTPASH